MVTVGVAAIVNSIKIAPIASHFRDYDDDNSDVTIHIINYASFRSSLGLNGLNLGSAIVRCGVRDTRNYWRH